MRSSLAVVVGVIVFFVGYLVGQGVRPCCDSCKCDCKVCVCSEKCDCPECVKK